MVVTRALAVEYAYQSTAIELNPLSIGDALKIQDELDMHFFLTLSNLATLRPQDLTHLPLPPPIGLSNPNTAGITRSEIKHISRSMLLGTDAEDLYNHSWGARISLGDFRAIPITVRSNPLRIFPYHQEVPACLERFVQWRDECHATSQLHPLILATQLFVYFCHIHPFLDGNGRVGRSLMADYLARQGYLPVVLRDLDRSDYVRMVSDAQDGKPEELCEMVAFTQWEMLFTISLRS